VIKGFSPDDTLWRRSVQAFKRQLLVRTLTAHGGNKSHAATALGLQRTHLVLLCHELGVRLNPRCHWGRPDCTCEQGSTCLGA